MKPQHVGAQTDTGARIVDKRKNWEARVEMAILKRPASELSVYDKMVYTILCGHANRDGNAMLYVKTIAEEASCSERQVQRAFVNLESRRLLVRHSQSIPGRGRTFNVYEIYGFDEYTPGDCQTPPDCQSPGGVSDSHTPVSISHHPGDCQAEPNNVFQQPLYNSKKEHIPPTPQGGEGREREILKPQSPKNDTEEKEQISKMPFMDILAAFNEILPELPKAEVLTSSRIQTLKLRLNEDPVRQHPDWWRRYFERVRFFPWLMGRNPSSWKATFDWLTGEDGMRKVIEAAFSQAPRVNQAHQAYEKYSPEELREWQRKYTDERGIVDAKALLRDWRARTSGTH